MMLLATRTTGKRNPSMVKRRNSPFASFGRAASRNVKIDCAVVMVAPLPTPPKQPNRRRDSGAR